MRSVVCLCFVSVGVVACGDDGGFVEAQCVTTGDDDGDGFVSAGDPFAVCCDENCGFGDCNDDDPGVHPSLNGSLVDVDGDGIDQNCDGVDGNVGPFIPFACNRNFPPVPLLAVESLLRTRAAVVCWVEDEADVGVDDVTGLRRIALSGVLVPRRVPEGLLPFGFDAGQREALEPYGFRIENRERTTYCAAGIVNDGLVAPLDLALIFDGGFTDDEVGFLVDEDGAASALQTSRAFVGAGLLPAEPQLVAGSSVGSAAVADCGSVQLQTLFLGDVELRPGELESLTDVGQALLVTAQTGDGGCGDVIDLFFSDTCR